MKRSVAFRLAGPCFLVFALTSGSLSAQTSAGALVGLVRDPAGAAIPRAAVTVTNTQTNVSSRLETDASGNYFVPSVTPGIYSVTCAYPGFKRVLIEPVTVSVNQTVRVDLTLPVGDAAESVTVQEYTSLVQADNATIGQVVTTRQLTELPLNGRDFRNLLSLNPGVTQPHDGIATASSIRRQGFNDSIRLVSINGARPSSVSYLVDGVSMNEPLFQFPSQVPPIEAVDEFKLQNALYSAEFGMGVGQVSIAMKSGTNELHGSLWDFLRNDALQKFQPRFHNKTPLKQNQFGFVTGGPVFLPKIYDGRNHTFFLVSYNGGRRATGSNGVTQVPTAAEKQGDFSSWPTQLFDPLSSVLTPGASLPVAKTPFAGNRIPSTRFAPQSSNLIKYWPSPSFACPAPCNNYQGALKSNFGTDQYTVRADHNFSAGDRISWQLLHSAETAPIPSLIPLSGLTATQRSWMSSAQWTHVFSPRLVNELRLAYNHFTFDQTFETGHGGVIYWKDAGLKNLNENYQALPAILTGTQYSSIGNGGSVPFLNISDTQHYVEHLTFTAGKHSLKMGVDFRRGRNTDISGFQGNGVITFNGQYTARNPTLAQVAGRPDTGNGFADFLMGYASLAAGTPFDSGAGRFWNKDANLFLQDDIHLTPRLTVNVGIRWEYRGPWYERSGGGKIFDYGYAGGRALYRDKKFVDQVNNPIFASCCSSDSVYNPDYRNFAPRAGAAWRPLGSNRFVVRAGYGIYYDVLDRYYDVLPFTVNQPFILPTLPSVNGLESQPPLDMRTLFPTPLPIGQQQFAPPYCQAPATTSTDPATGKITVTNQCFGQGLQYAFPNNKTPYTQNWGLNLQFEPRQRMLLEMGYQGSHGLRGQRQAQANNAVLPPTAGNPNNSNQFASQCPPGTYPTTCSPIQSRVPYANFIPQLQTYLNDNQSSYNALTMKVEQRFNQGLQVLAAFTWSKTMDEVSEIQTQGGNVKNDPQYAYRKDLDRGVAAYDQTRRFITSLLYELPFGKGKHWLNSGNVVNAILGGWQANTIMTFAGGLPVTISCYCGDRAQTGNNRNVERMNVVSNPLPNGFKKTIYQQFDTSAFKTPALGTLGTVGRNTIRGPGQRAVDLSVFKNFRFRERFGAQLRAEAFNLIASPYYTNIYPGYNASATDFGSLVPAGGDKGNIFSPRIYQMALRFMF
jgi:hypothetical protein